MGFVLTGTALAFLFIFNVSAFSADIAQILSSKSGNIDLQLDEDSTATNVVVEGRRVHIVGTGEFGTTVSATTNRPMFIVGAGGVLILEDIALKAMGPGKADGATTAILVEGGSLSLSYCSFEGTTTFAVYARGGTVTTLSCGLQSGVNALGLTEGTQLVMRDTSITGFTETALVARDQATRATLRDVRISHANRAISVSDGAEIKAEALTMSSIAEVGIFTNSGSLSLDGFVLSDSPKFGVYVDGAGDVSLQNGRFEGPLETAVSLRGSGTSMLSDLTLSAAQTGISVPTADRDVEISGLSSSANLPDAIHIAQDGGRMTVDHAVLLGGRTGIRTRGDSRLSLTNSLIAGVGQAGLSFQGGDSGIGRLSVLWNRIWVSGDAVAVQAENTRIGVLGNLISFETVALSGSAFGKAQIENNGFAGPVSSVLWLGDHLAQAPGWINTARGVLSDGLQRQFATAFQPDPGDIAGDIAALGARFDELQSELGVSPTAVGVHTIVLAESDIRPAAYSKVFDVYRRNEAGETAFLGTAYGEDLPLRVAPGSYRFDLGRAGVVDADLPGDDIFELPYAAPDRPYALDVDGGKLTAGRSLELRPRQEMHAYWADRWPGYFALAPDFERGYPVLRPDATADQIEAARVRARAQIEAVAPTLTSVPAGAVYADFTGEALKQHEYSWRIVPTATDILMVAGTEDDARVLAETAAAMRPSPTTTHLATLLARASVQISLRQGDVAASPAVSIWQGLEDKPYGSARTKLSIALGSAGYQPAIEALRRAIATERHTLEDPGRSANLVAFQLIAHRYHPDVLALSVDLLRAFDENSKASSLVRANPDSTSTHPNPWFNGIHLGAAFDTALGYGATYLDESDRSSLGIGLPWWNTPSLLPFNNSADVVDHIFGIASHQFHGKTDRNLMDLGCRLMGDLNQADRPRSEAAYVGKLTELAIAKSASLRPGAFAEIHTKIALSHCEVNSRMFSALKSPENYDISLFPTWMRHGLIGPDGFLPDFDELPASSVDATAALAGYEAATLNPVLEALDDHARTGLQFYELLYAIADSSGLGKPGPFAGGNDKRYFLESAKIPEGQDIALAGEVTLAPRIAEGRKLFGISLSIAVGDLGGLAGMINRAGQQIDALVADSGRGMIEKVILRYDGGASELQYIQSTATGTHVFEMVDPVASNANLYLDIYFQGIERGWTVTFPLFASPFGFDQIQSRGRLTLAD